jgi:undecaprenyl-diphosphatase
MESGLKQWWRSAGWNEWIVLAVLSVFSLAVWAFIELADDAPEGDYLELETRILRSFRSPNDPGVGIGPHWLPEVARDLTAMGSTVVLTLLITLVMASLVLRGRRRTALFIVGATIGGALLSVGLKTIVGRERPTAVPHLMVETSLSFPSGHSMLSSVVYLTLGAALASTVKRRREKTFFVVAAAFLSFLIGVSRVYMGVHYPTDVLAGWSAGTAWALLCGSIAWWLQQRGKLKTPAEPSSDSEGATG